MASLIYSQWSFKLSRDSTKQSRHRQKQWSHLEGLLYVMQCVMFTHDLELSIIARNTCGLTLT